MCLKYKMLIVNYIVIINLFINYIFINNFSINLKFVI